MLSRISFSVLVHKNSVSNGTNSVAIFGWLQSIQVSRRPIVLKNTSVSRNGRRGLKNHFFRRSYSDRIRSRHDLCYRVNFLCFKRLGSSASGPSLRFLSSS